MLDKFTNTKFWKWFVNFFGNIRIYKFGIVILGETSYHIKGPQFRQILDILKDGDVLLRRYDHYIGGLAIPGYWTHAGQYTKDGKVIHMLGDGIAKEDVLTFLRTDHVCVLRCKNPDLIPHAVKKAEDLYDEDVEYDYQFKADNKTLYCSEMIYHDFDMPDEIKFEDYILPDDLHCDLFEEVWIDKAAKKELHKRRIVNINIEGS